MKMEQSHMPYTLHIWKDDLVLDTNKLDHEENARHKSEPLLAYKLDSLSVEEVIEKLKEKKMKSIEVEVNSPVSEEREKSVTDALKEAGINVIQH